MISQDRNVPMAHRVPVMILAPLAAIVAAIYPAIWNPAPSVRRVFSTLMVIGLVCLVLGAVATFRRWVVDITDKVIDRQVRQMRSEAIAQLDAHTSEQVDAKWDEIVRRFTGQSSERPEESR